jgi:hypothetical protein
MLAMIDKGVFLTFLKNSRSSAMVGVLAQPLPRKWSAISSWWYLLSGFQPSSSTYLKIA